MTITFTGTLQASDHKSHIPHTFEVPVGTTRLVCRFDYAPARATGALFDNMLCLSLFGPNGARGARHNNDELNFSIDAAAATPGYQRGAIEPGFWRLFIDTFRVLGPEPVTYSIEIDCEQTEIAPQAAWPVAPVADHGRRWYRGDLHAHTWHSDATWDVPDLVNWARRRKLDFVTLTDHNTVSGHEQILALGGDDLLIMGGLELTTHYGHALALGTRQWQEWRTGSVTGLAMPQVADMAMRNGALYVIAHPEAPGDPSCTGCHWDFTDMRPGNARIVEIWNGGEWSDYNESGLALYRAWLDAGHRLMATAGSDIHGAHDDKPLIGFNNVLAEGRSEVQVMAAIAQGRNFLSSGPRLVVQAVSAAGTTVEMGGTAAPGDELLVAFAEIDEDLRLRLIANGGQILGEVEVTGQADSSHRAMLPHDVTWVMAELRNSAGTVRAVTNPIFVQKRMAQA